MSKPFSYYSGPGRRSAVSGSDREIEMRPLTNNNHSNVYNNNSNNRSHFSNTTRLQHFIEKLNHHRTRNNHKKEKRRGGRTGFAVNIPSRLIFHVIIVFFFIPLILGMMLLIRALFFRLKEDETHPLHKKLPHSNLKNQDNDIVVGDDLQDVPNIDNIDGFLKNQTLVDPSSTNNLRNENIMEMNQYDLNSTIIISMQQQIEEEANKNKDSFNEKKSLGAADFTNFSMISDSSRAISNGKNIIVKDVQMDKNSRNNLKAYNITRH